MIKQERIKELRSRINDPGKVIYWMSRDQRSEDNWGLLYARELSKKYSSEMAVVFCLANNFLEATERQYHFMLEGLKEVYSELKNKNIPFYLLLGDPVDNLSKFIQDHNIIHVVTDFDPLRIKQKWQQEVCSKNAVGFYEVDSHNIVPARHVSNKQEFGAYTIRPKIHRMLEDFLDEYPTLEKQQQLKDFKIRSIDWERAFRSLNIDRNVKAVDWLTPGKNGAQLVFDEFYHKKFRNYSSLRNDPNRDVLSNLSPYYHFGHISTQRVALEILKKSGKSENVDAYLEEMIVRRELSDNYCLYNKNYDSLENIPDWAKKTLAEHRRDEREYIYSTEEFENAQTHEDLWNAAQNEMRKKGKMHGYMRMYWAKKILEWSKSPEEAMKIAVYLNDKYELDGRDPNGYTGCAWAIGGVHDRAWTERPVYGKIRYMNYNGAKRKFDVKSYIDRWNSPELF